MRRFIAISAVVAFVVELGLLWLLTTMPLDIEPDPSDPLWIHFGQIVAALVHVPAFWILRMTSSTGDTIPPPYLGAAFFFVGYLDLLCVWFGGVLLWRVSRRWRARQVSLRNADGRIFSLPKN